MSLSWKTPLPHLLHGADYNPEQWPADTWKEDVRLMTKAGVNVVSLGIFAWSHLEPEEGGYEFGWMDEIIGLLKNNGISTILATPSGARPPWLAHKYPEVLRVNEMGVRNLFGARHNHCPTSPVYRRKVAEINGRLAQRYGANDAVILWHISNEYNGACHCDRCQSAFREWLRTRYETLERLNAAWWTSFWSHRFTDWNEIDAPSSRGEQLLHGLTLAWQRFTTEVTADFYRAEVAALRKHDRRTPATTNFMGLFNGLDYFRLSREVDIVSWDSYPSWHSRAGTEAVEASMTAMVHDLNRSMKGGQPFLLMESTPSQVNWQSVNKLKRPGMHLLASIQAVAHGSDSVQYFQWRKSRGASEKFHGAVVGHDGTEDTRTFREVSELGRVLAKIGGVRGGRMKTETAVIYDWNNRWAIDAARMLRNDRKNYPEEVQQYYRALWNLSLPVDCIDETFDFAGYKLLIAPFLYLLRPGVAERLQAFVASGGTLVLSHGAGSVDDDDLVFTGGPPGPLRAVAGLWVEEADALYDHDKVEILPLENSLGLSGTYGAHEICERLRLETAQPLARYGSDFYAGEPSLTVNAFGSGRAYYVGFRSDDRLINDFLKGVVCDLKLRTNWPAPLPQGVNVQCRSGQEAEYLFVMNFNHSGVSVALPSTDCIDVVTGHQLSGQLELGSLGVRILRRKTG